MSLFGKKKNKGKLRPGKGFDPIARVREMAARGFSEPEMIDVLRRDGFGANEIDNALTQALRIGVGQNQKMQQNNYQMQKPQMQQPQMQQPQMQQPQMQQQMQKPQMQSNRNNENELPTIDSITSMTGQPNQLSGSMPQIPETSLPEGYYSQTYSSEDYVDYVVQQRLGEVTEKVKEFQEYYKKLNNKISELTDNLKNMETKSEPNKNAVNNKIENFTSSVSDIDNRLSGLEKAFKETLPDLIDSVRTLSDLVQKIKKDKE